MHKNTIDYIFCIESIQKGSARHFFTLQILSVEYN